MFICNILVIGVIFLLFPVCFKNSAAELSSSRIAQDGIRLGKIHDVTDMHNIPDLHDVTNVKKVSYGIYTQAYDGEGIKENITLRKRNSDFNIEELHVSQDFTLGYKPKRLADAGAVLGNMSSLYLPINLPPDSACRVAVTFLLENLKNKTLWALLMVDAWGKLPDGMFLGNYHPMGMFDQCLRVNIPASDLTLAGRGKYCVVYMIPLEAEINASSYSVTHSRDFSPGLRRNPNGAFRDLQPDPRIAFVGLNLPFYLYYANIFSTCIPDACSKTDYTESLRVSLAPRGFQPFRVECQVEGAEINFTAEDISFIAFLSLLGFLMVFGAALDVYMEKTKDTSLKKGPLRFVLPFSVYTNLHKLFHVNTSPVPGSITCLHSMRVLSMIWVIWCHQYSTTIYLSYNALNVNTKSNSMIIQVITNGFLSVDTFFFLSGLLLSYGLLREMKKTGRANLVMYYVHRIIRLTPPIAMTCWFYATLVRYMVTGPVASDAEYLRRGCAKYWWRDVLYINNYLTDAEFPYEEAGDCLFQCWYTSVDTQLYLVAPLFVLPLYYKPKIGRVWLYIVTLVSVIVPASLISVYDLPPTLLLPEPSETSFLYSTKIYNTPYGRAGPWVVGLWAGYVLYVYSSKKLKMKQWQVVAGWSVAVVAGLLVQFGMYSYNVLPTFFAYDPVTQIMYGSLHKVVWGICLAWVVLACHYGYGGPVNAFLSHPSWQPLSRLTYAMYLVALNGQEVIMQNTRTPFYFTHLNKVLETVGAMFMCGVCSILLSLSIEAPVMGLEKLLLSRPGRGEGDNISNTKVDDKLMKKGDVDRGNSPADNSYTQGKINLGMEMQEIIKQEEYNVIGLQTSKSVFPALVQLDMDAHHVMSSRSNTHEEDINSSVNEKL